MDQYQELANAIIKLAAIDYRKALKQLKKNPKSEKANIMARDCERFFNGKWMGVLTQIDGPWLMEKLKEEVIK